MVNKKEKNYFKEGQGWYMDRIEAVKIQSNRWFLGFILSTLLSIILVIGIVSLFPLKRIEPLIIHHNTITNDVWVEHPKTPYVPVNNAEVETDIVRYIVSRESYTASDINQRFHSVNLMSDRNVAKEYSDEQANSNKISPVNLLGVLGKRTVRIEDVIFLDKSGIHNEIRDINQPSQNLAKVDFVTTTFDHQGVKKIENWVATIAWVYRGLPENKQDAWDDWNGFMVTTYRVDPKNIENLQ